MLRYFFHRPGPHAQSYGKHMILMTLSVFLPRHLSNLSFPLHNTGQSYLKAFLDLAKDSKLCLCERDVAGRKNRYASSCFLATLAGVARNAYCKTKMSISPYSPYARNYGKMHHSDPFLKKADLDFSSIICSHTSAFGKDAWKAFRHFHRHCAGDQDAVLTTEEQQFQASDCCQIAWLNLLFADIRTT